MIVQNHQINIEHDLNIVSSPANIDYQNFNELKLSNQLPFVKLRISGEVVYNIFKPTRVNSDNMNLLLKRNVKHWINFVGTEFESGVLNKIKGNNKS